MKNLESGMRVLVADGSHALVLRNDGDAIHPHLTVVRVYDQDNPPTHDQGSQRPDRTQWSSSRHSALEVPDYHQMAEDRFIARLAEDMEKDLQKGGFSKAVVAAAPVALGTFRKCCSPTLAEAIVLTVHKDLSKHSVADVTKIIQQALEQA